MYFSPRNAHIYTYTYMHTDIVTVCDSKLDLKTSVGKIHDQPYLFQFHFILREPRHMITSPTIAATTSTQTI